MSTPRGSSSLQSIVVVLSILVFGLAGYVSGCKESSPGSDDAGDNPDAGDPTDAEVQNDAEVPPGSFLIEDVSELDVNGFLPDIALQGGVPIVYFTVWTGGNREVWRAERSGADDWSRTLIVPDTGFDTSDLTAAIDAAGDEHVVAAPYYGDSLPLLYAGSAGAWTAEGVTLNHGTYSAVDVANHSLTTGPGGTTALAFYAHDHAQLIYAWRTASPGPATGPWSLSVTPAFTQVLTTAVALDATGTPHLGYVQVINNQRYPYYAQWDPGLLNFVENQETFDFQSDSNPDVGSGLGFGLRGDTPFFVLADHKTGELVYCERQGWYTWTREVIDAGADTGGKFTISAAAGPSGDIHVAYIDGNRLALRYAVRTGDTWTTDTVHSYDPQSAEYQHVRLAVDPTNTPHITYLDTRDRVVRYATPAP